MAADLDGNGERDYAGVLRSNGEAVVRFVCDDTEIQLGLLKTGPTVERIERVGNGLLAVAREGASGGAVTARGYRYSECGQQREVFRYPPKGGTPLPRGAELATDAEVRADGRRIRVVERFTRPGEAVCCPSLERTSIYALRARRFERVESELRRLPTAPRR